MQCPGQDNRYWDGEAVFEIPCPQCGNVLEFFKDDSQRSCKQCGHRVLNPRIDFGCAAYCSHAEQCLGAMPPELLAKQKNLFKDKLSLAVRKQLAGRDELFKKASLCTEIAEKLCKEEQRGDMAAVLAATLLVDITTPDILLEELKTDPKMITSVNKLLGQQAPETNEEQASADIFHDACLLTEIQLGQNKKSPTMRTISGKNALKEQ